MKSLSVTTLIAHNFMLYTFVHYALQYCEAYFTNWISEHFVCIVISNRFVTFLQQHRSIYLKSILCKQWNLYPIAKKDSNQLRQKNCQMFFLSCPWKNPLLLTLWYLLFVALKTHTLMQSKAVCWRHLYGLTSIKVMVVVLAMNVWFYPEFEPWSEGVSRFLKTEVQYFAFALFLLLWTWPCCGRSFEAARILRVFGATKAEWDRELEVVHLLLHR